MKIASIYTLTLCLFFGLAIPQSFAQLNCTASFSIPSTVACSADTIVFTNSSTNANTFFWDFGDGNTSTDANPEHIYTSAGSYTISLIASSATCSDTTTNSLTINASPTASFTATNSKSCFPFLFTNFSSTSSPNVNSWFWDFGDGGTSTVAGGTNHTYFASTLPAFYDVSLTVTNTDGCSVTVYKPNFIQLAEPEADFEADQTQGCIPFDVQFADSTFSVDGVVSWFWDFGDGGTSTQQNPIHTYTTPGIYDVSLIITTTDFCQDTIAKTAYIQANQASLGLNFLAVPEVTCAVDPVVFFNTSTITQNIDFYWEFGDGTQKTGLNASYFYQDTGFFDVTLIGETVDGCRDTFTIDSAVRVVEPVSLFEVDDYIVCELPATIQFIDSSISANTWEWDFGDSTTSFQQNPTHTYTQAGTYTVSLLTQNLSSGCEDVITKTISIGNPIAGFSASDPIGCGAYTVDFINSSPNTETYVWDFGDGNTSADPTPSHIYSNSGVYDVQLVAIDSLGCSDTLTQSSYVTIGDLTGDFIADQTAGCVPFNVNFSSIYSLTPSVNQLAYWSWDFGDGTSSTDSMPTHTYTSPGNYDISLRLVSNLGCRDTIVKVGYISANGPSVSFEADETDDCAPLVVNFGDSTGAFGGNISTWNWDFGDGGTSSVQHPTYTYTTPGLYDVSLLVVDDNGCRDSLMLNNYIDVCTPLSTTFDCDSLANCSIGSLGDVDLVGIDSGEVLVWNGMQFVGDSLMDGSTNVWDLNGNDAYYVDGLVGIGTSNMDAVLKLERSNLDSLPAFKVEASDNNSPLGYTFEIKGHPTGTSNASNHVQLTTGESASRMTLKAGIDADRAPRLQMTGAGESNNPGWAIFDYGSKLIDLPNASFKMRYMSISNPAVDMIQAQADSAVLLVPEKGKVGIGTQNPQELLHVAGEIRSDALAGGGNVIADANGNLSIGTDEINDADADPTNELLMNANLVGSTLQLTDAGGTLTVDLSSLGSGMSTSDADWSFTTGNSLSDPIYRSGSVGIGNSSPQAKLHLTNGSVLFDGTVGATPASGAGSRMMWVAEKGAFRSGTVFGTQWDDANIGLYSVGMGVSSVASGIGSVAMGQETEASARGAVAMGRETTASGEGSTAFGRDNIASSQGATAFGFGTEASGFAATTMGVSTLASGDYAFAMGANTLASGFNSLAAGSNSEAFGSYATAVGEATQSSFTSLALGRNNLDTGSSTAWVGTDFVLSIGDGSSSSSRSNCLYVQKNGDMWLQGTLTQFSDRRLKENISDLGDVLPKIEQLNGVSYDWKDGNMSQERQLGVIAQELEAVYPELVTEVEGYKAVNYIGLIPVLLEGIKQQQSIIESQQSAMQLQQNSIEGLQSDLSEIKELLQAVGISSSSTQSIPQNPSSNNSSTQNPQPTHSQLFQNQPNPFTHQTEIPYFLKESEPAEIIVYEMQSGKIVRRFEIQGEGFGSVSLESEKLPAGVYAYQLSRNGAALDAKRMVLVD